MLSILAIEGEKLLPKSAVAQESLIGAMRKDIDSSFAWTVLEGERHTGTCGNDI